MTEDKLDIKECNFLKEVQMEQRPSSKMSEVVGSNSSTTNLNKMQDVEVKPEFNSNYFKALEMREDSDEQNLQDENDDSDFDIKEEDRNVIESDESEESTKESEVCLTKRIKLQKKSRLTKKIEYLQDVTPTYERVVVKSYSRTTLKEEPLENLKSMFKESPLEFERHKYHQKIFEKVVESSGKTKLKDLQTEYIDQLREAANIDIFTCSLCDYQTMNLKNLNCHLIINHNGKTEQEVFRCNICDYETNFTSHITRHMTVHEKPKTKIKKDKEQKFNNQQKYPCPECSYKGRSEDGLKAHMSCHKDKTKCDLCSFQSSNKNELKQHKDTHKIGHNFHCYECDYRNGNKLTLALHLKKKHNIDNEMSKRSKICEICSFAAVDRYKLQQHYMTHKTVKDLQEDEIFKCPEEGCNYQTKLKAHLVAHIPIHKPPEFICEVCGFATHRKQNYKYHLETHKKLSEIEWLPCPLCPYQARSKRHLWQHMKIGAHDDKNRRHIRKRNLLAEGLPVPPPRGTKKKRDIMKDEINEGEVKKPKRKKKPKGKKQSNVPSLEDSFGNFDQLTSAFLGRNETS